jgi:hypothetical protein
MGRARREPHPERPLTLDAGALIALEAGDTQVKQLLATAAARGLGIAIPAGVLAQVWRDGRRQVLLARLVRSAGTRVHDLTEDVAKAAGELCGRAGTSDVIDATVVICVRNQRNGVVVSGDSSDLRRLDSRLHIEPA